MSEQFGDKSAAKKQALAPSESLEARIRACIDAGNLEGAIELVHGIITEKCGYHARRLGLSKAALEDCIHDALVRIMEKWDRVRRSDHPVAYVRRLAMHVVIDAFRQEKRIPEMPFPEIDPHAEDPILMEFEQDLLPQPDEMAVLFESCELFNRALEDLYRKSPGCRDSLALYQEAQNNDEKFDAFCRRLGLEHQTMYARFRRCIEQIIDHHLFPKFRDLVARLYPNVSRKKQAKRGAEGD